MLTYTGYIPRSLKWMHNKAPNITSLITQKSNWYGIYNTKFWDDWKRDVFDLRTANSFGLMIWCIILGVPSQAFGLYAKALHWAYGPFRQNFKWSGIEPPPSDANLLGGNFTGGSDRTVLNIKEVRACLRLRYYALVGNGSLAFINYALRDVFKEFVPNGVWDYPGGQYVYASDESDTFDTTAPLVLEYRIGANVAISQNMINLLNLKQFGILPKLAGVKTIVVRD